MLVGHLAVEIILSVSQKGLEFLLLFDSLFLLPAESLVLSVLQLYQPVFILCFSCLLFFLELLCQPLALGFVHIQLCLLFGAPEGHLVVNGLHCGAALFLKIGFQLLALFFYFSDLILMFRKIIGLFLVEGLLVDLQLLIEVVSLLLYKGFLRSHFGAVSRHLLLTETVEFFLFLCQFGLFFRELGGKLLTEGVLFFLKLLFKALPFLFKLECSFLQRVGSFLLQSVECFPVLTETLFLLFQDYILAVERRTVFLTGGSAGDLSAGSVLQLFLLLFLGSPGLGKRFILPADCLLFGRRCPCGLLGALCALFSFLR